MIVLKIIRDKRARYLPELAMIAVATIMLVAGWFVYLEWCLADEVCLARTISHEQAKWGMK
ncbi:MAG: hypothetical protein K8U57_08670 [Planctomycetes bacterium]|nr:hypothetical protein [Planctomycetota bacterium]